MAVVLGLMGNGYKPRLLLGKLDSIEPDDSTHQGYVNLGRAMLTRALDDPERIIEKLITTLRGTNEYRQRLREYSALGLGFIGVSLPDPTKVLKALSDACNGPDEITKTGAMEGLGILSAGYQYPAQLIELIRPFLSHSWETTQSSALYSLGLVSWFAKGAVDLKSIFLDGRYSNDEEIMMYSLLGQSMQASEGDDVNEIMSMLRSSIEEVYSEGLIMSVYPLTMLFLALSRSNYEEGLDFLDSVKTHYGEPIASMTGLAFGILGKLSGNPERAIENIHTSLDGEDMFAIGNHLGLTIAYSAMDDRSEMIDRLKAIIQDENVNENYSPYFALMLGILVSEDTFIQAMSIAYAILPVWSQSLGLGLLIYNLFNGQT